MPDGLNIDFSQFDKLAADLGTVPAKSGPFIRKALEVTSRNIKDAWRDKLKGEPHLPKAPFTIGYDIKNDETHEQMTAEIGAERGKPQAPIVTVIEFGAPGNNLAPRGFGLAALSENQADFEKGLSKALEDAEKAVGL